MRSHELDINWSKFDPPKNRGQHLLEVVYTLSPTIFLRNFIMSSFERIITEQSDILVFYIEFAYKNPS
jgi:hypothetical protein